MLAGVRPLGCCYLSGGLFAVLVNPQSHEPSPFPQPPGLDGLARIDRLVTDRLVRRVGDARVRLGSDGHGGGLDCLGCPVLVHVSQRLVDLTREPQAMR